VVDFLGVSEPQGTTAEKMLVARQAIEPITGYLKADHRMDAFDQHFFNGPLGRIALKTQPTRSRLLTASCWLQGASFAQAEWRHRW
jgi:hypothetical protein